MHVNRRQIAPNRDIFLWAQLWAYYHCDQSGIVIPVGSSPSEAAISLA